MLLSKDPYFSLIFSTQIEVGSILDFFPPSAISLPHLAPLGFHLLVQIKLFCGERTSEMCINITPTQVAFNLQFNTKLSILLFGFLSQ